MKKRRNIDLSKNDQLKKNLTDLIIYFFLFSLLLFPLWLNKKFGLLYYEQFRFNLTLIYYGYLDGDSNMIDSFIKWLVIVPIFLSIILIFIKRIINFFNTNKDKSIDLIIRRFNFIKKNYYKYYIDKIFLWINFIIKKISYILLIITIILFYFFTNFFVNISNDVDMDQSNVDYLDLNYVYPDINSNGINSNLVLLYVESLENTLTDKEIFNENLIKEISGIIEGESVKYFYQIPGQGFTFASLVSTQCGIPLLQISNSHINSKDLKGVNKFLPNLTCLTDILAELDYENIFVSSDYLKNSMTDKFLLTHKYSKLYGLEELIDMGYKTSKNAYHNKRLWSGGIHDNTLLDASIDILKEHKKNSNKNFFMSIMTLDTHAPEGTPNQECLQNLMNKNDLKDFKITESFKCTSAYVRDFIDAFKELNLENTNLIIIGDHLLMKTLKKKHKDRYIYNKFLIDDKFEIKRDYINYYDFYPSILEVMNFNINNPDGKVALGYSIFSNTDQYNLINFNLKGTSKLYDDFWNLYTQ